MRIRNTHQLKVAMRTYGQGDGFYVADDGDEVCPDCVREHYRDVLSAIRERRNDGWRLWAFVELRADDESTYGCPCVVCGQLAEDC